MGSIDILARGALSAGLVAAFAGSSHADPRYFFLFIGKDEAPSQTLVESAWREAGKVESVASVEASTEHIGRVFPRLFSGGRAAENVAIDGELDAAKAAYIATDFEEAETHYARVFAGAIESPELLASSPKTASRLADAAVARYSNAIARRQSPAVALKDLESFVAKFPTLTPTNSEHAPDVLATWDRAREGRIAQAGGLVVDVVPLELARSGACHAFVNGVDLATLPSPGPLRVPLGDHYLQVRCGLQASWIQRVTIGSGVRSVVVPVRAMVAARADVASGGIVLVSPEEGDSAALVGAVSAAAGFDGAVVARAGRPRRWEFGVWQPASDAPTLLATGASEGGVVSGVHAVSGGDGGGLSPWPFVVGGAGIATLAGGVAANLAYLTDRDAGKQDLDPVPAAVLYGIGGALVVTGVVMLVLELGDDGPAALAEPGRGSTMVLVRF